MPSRRRFLLGSSILCAVPLAAMAQGRGKIHLVGCVPGGLMAPREHQWAAFRRALRELGYVEGRNVKLEFRIPQVEGIAGDKLVAELLALKVDVIVLSTAFHAHAAKRITQTVPIVMTGVTDPVAAGLISNLARPEGNLTGVSLLSADLSGKRFEVLRELLPQSKRIAVLWNPNDASGAPQLKAVQNAARGAGVEIISLEARAAGDLAAVFETAAKQRAEGLIVASSGLFYGLRDPVMELLRNAKLPAIWPWGSFGGFGALLVYGASDTENYRRAAAFVDRILRGAKPRDLPIEQATNVEFVINLKTAKALGLTMPPSFRLRATQVFE